MKAAGRREPQLAHLAVALLALFLFLFLALPVGRLVLSTLGDNASGHSTFGLLLANPLYLDSLIGSLTASTGAALLAAALALPLAWALWRLQWQPPLAVQLLGFMPLFVPPFMLSLSLQSLLGRGGGPGFWLAGRIDLDPSQWGLAGLIVIEAIHYAPLLLSLVVLSTAPFARDAGIAAHLGDSWSRLTRRVFLPLGIPGLAFGMAITFLKTLDDLATPLSLGLTTLIAPLAYFRVGTHGANDLIAAALALVLIVVSMLAWMLGAGSMRQIPMTWNGTHPAPPAARLGQRRLAAALLAAVAGLLALCYSGMALTAFAGVWSHTLWPESWGLQHFAAALATESASFINTLRYCGTAALIDVVIGLAIAYVLRRAPARRELRLTQVVAGLLGVPGVALAIAYLQCVGSGIAIPFDTTGILLALAFALRGLPFALPACSYALRSLPDAHLDAARLSGASTFLIARRIILPALAFGLVVAFLISFGIAAVDLSSAMLLIPSETEAPAAYTIYLNMQTSTGRGIGSALAVLAIAAVAIVLTATAALIARRDPGAADHRSDHGATP